MNKKRYTDQWFETKRKALDAEASRREEIKNPKPIVEVVEQPTPPEQEKTVITFGELANRRLYHLEVYATKKYFKDLWYVLRRLKAWKDLPATEITKKMVETHVKSRAKKKGNYAANADIRYLKALFYYGIKHEDLTMTNPVTGIDTLPTEKKPKYIPPPKDINAVFNVAVANRDWYEFVTIVRQTIGRRIEGQRLEWDRDVDLVNRTVALNTRKKRGGNMKARKIRMTDEVFEILSRRYQERDPKIPWVFWRRYYSRKQKKWVVGPFGEDMKIMQKLCQKAEVAKKYGFHNFRHLGASIMGRNGAPLTGIQAVLGHEHATTTDGYLQDLLGGDKVAMDIFERFSHTFSHTESHKDQKEIAAHPY